MATPERTDNPAQFGFVFMNTQRTDSVPGALKNAGFGGFCWDERRNDNRHTTAMPVIAAEHTLYCTMTVPFMPIAS